MAVWFSPEESLFLGRPASPHCHCHWHWDIYGIYISIYIYIYIIWIPWNTTHVDYQITAHWIRPTSKTDHVEYSPRYSYIITKSRTNAWGIDIYFQNACVAIGLCICLYLWAVMLRVGRSVVVGHSGGCRCPGDHAALQARASVWREWAVARVGTGSLSRVVQQWSTEEMRSVVNCRSCE